MPPEDLDGLVRAASELTDALKNLEQGIGGEVDRERIRRHVVPFDPATGQPFQLTLGEVTLFASPRQDGREQRPQPNLALGLLRDDVALVAAARWAVAEIVRASTFGHIRAEVVDDVVRPVGTDAFGDALLRIAGRLTQSTPARRLRRCARCGKEIGQQRSTRLYCSNACKQAMVRARRRAREEDVQ